LRTSGKRGLFFGASAFSELAIKGKPYNKKEHDNKHPADGCKAFEIIDYVHFSLKGKKPSALQR
jgi:hypothetical protein